MTWRCYPEGMRFSMTWSRSTILALALLLGGGCYMQHDDPPTPDAGRPIEDDASTPLPPVPTDDAGSPEVDAGAPPAPLMECVAGTWPSADSDGSEPEGTVRVAFNYPRTSPDYELDRFVEWYAVERSAELDALLETGAGLVEVPMWAMDSFIVVGRDEAGAAYRLLTRDEAIARCPGFPTDE